ncbi:hypothetical protein RB195_009874 [Necator americanus]|uniref:Uncharacterized protein n=1 Tax=Necator americanus TaxID=51031 RepID=A0ABR1CXR9_NECAM
MTICTYNARTLTSDAAIEDLIMRARKISNEIIGLIETKRCLRLNAVFETGEELFLGTCDSRIGRVGIFVNTSTTKNIDSLEQPESNICG